MEQKWHHSFETVQSKHQIIKHHKTRQRANTNITNCMLLSKIWVPILPPWFRVSKKARSVMDLRLHHPSPSIKEWRVQHIPGCFPARPGRFLYFWSSGNSRHGALARVDRSWGVVGCYVFLLCFSGEFMKALTKLQNSWLFLVSCQVQKLCPEPWLIMGPMALLSH